MLANNYKFIIENIRAIVNGSNCSSKMIHDLLIAHNCHYMANKNADASDTKIQLATRISTKTRYKLLEPFFCKISAINYAVIKGAVLSQQIYGAPFYRTSNDIDILIGKNDVTFVKDILTAQGFVQGRLRDGKIQPYTREELIFYSSQSHQVAPFVKITSNKCCPTISIDINCSMFWGEHGDAMSAEFALQHLETSNVYDVKIKKLSNEIEFISLCLHHYKDLNSIYLLLKGSYKLCLFADIFYYIKNVPINVEVLQEKAMTLNALPYVYYCLWYTNKIFQSEKIEALLDRFKSAEDVLLLNAFGLDENEHIRWEIDFWDRLFSPRFKKEFINMLDEKMIKKIKINQQYM